MKRLVLIIAFIMASMICLSQKMCIVDNKYDADFKIWITAEKYDADLRVAVTTNRHDVKSDINSGVWYITRNRHECDYKIYFVKNRYDSNLIIYYVPNKYQAGSRRPIEKNKL